MRVALEGRERGIIMRITPSDGYLQATVSAATELPPLDATDPTFVALHREVRERAAELATRRGLPAEAVDQMLRQITEPGQLADLVAGYLDAPLADRQGLLEALAIEDRLRRVLILVQRQIEVLSAQESIQSKVKEELGERQREVYLREQLRAIQKELGEDDAAGDGALAELKAKLDKLELPADARREVDREWSRLSRIGRESMESGVIRTYLETFAELPWNTRTAEHLDVQDAARILDEDHHGLARRQGPHPRVPRRPPARRRQGAQGPHPAVLRPARRRQDLDRQVDRPRDGPQVRPHRARRRARRGRHPRPPPHVRRRAARPDPRRA